MRKIIYHYRFYKKLKSLGENAVQEEIQQSEYSFPVTGFASGDTLDLYYKELQNALPEYDVEGLMQAHAHHDNDYWITRKQFMDCHFCKQIREEIKNPEYICGVCKDEMKHKDNCVVTYSCMEQCEKENS